MDKKNFVIEVSGTHRETDQRPFDRIVNALKVNLPPGGFTVLNSNAVFDQPDSVDATLAGTVADIPSEEEVADAIEVLVALYDPRDDKVGQVKEFAANETNVAVLQAAHALEELHPTREGGRAGVLTAIQARIDALLE